MDYFLRICVPILIISACFDKIDSATDDRQCYFCRETNDGPCHSMSNIASVRCTELVYSRTTNYEMFDNPDEFRSDGNASSQAENGHGGELEARSNGRPPATGTKFRCAKERRKYEVGDKNVLLRTCVLDQIADNYCQAVTQMGQIHGYEKYELTECQICDSDNCNFGSSLKVSFGLVAIVSAVLNLISM